MKTHIVVPLLVVCVAMPLVAMGMFYLCDSMPFVGDARAREKEYLVAQRQSVEKLAEKEEKDEIEDKTQETKKAVVKKSGKVAINGISINLPYEQLKHELAAKFGGIKNERLYGSFNFKVCSSRDDQAEAIMRIFLDFDPSLFCIRENSWDKKLSIESYLKQTSFNHKTAFDGEMTLCQNKSGESYVVVSKNRINDTDKWKYLVAVNDKYGSGEKLNESYGSHIRIMDDGIIVSVVYVYYDSEIDRAAGRSVSFDDDSTGSKFVNIFYFNKSVRDAYVKNHEIKKKERENYSQEAEEREKREERKRKEKAERIKARDAAGI